MPSDFASAHASNGHVVPDVGDAALLALDHEIARQKQRYFNMLLRNASSEDQLELLRFITSLQKIRGGAVAAMEEEERVTLEAQQRMSSVALMTQTYAQGLVGRVDEQAIADVIDVGAKGLATIAATHVAAMSAMHDAIIGYRPQRKPVTWQDKLAYRINGGPYVGVYEVE